jgi:flagellar biosynthesis/type III secretory pathway protein FliH
LEKAHQEGLEQGLEKGLEEGLEKGLEKGQIIGQQTLLLRLLRTKFGPLPEPFVQRLEAITDSEQLDELSEQLLTAATLDEIRLPAGTSNE